MYFLNLEIGFHRKCDNEGTENALALISRDDAGVCVTSGNDIGVPMRLEISSCSTFGGPMSSFARSLPLLT